MRHSKQHAAYLREHNRRKKNPKTVRDWLLTIEDVDLRVAAIAQADKHDVLDHEAMSLSRAIEQGAWWMKSYNGCEFWKNFYYMLRWAENDGAGEELEMMDGFIEWKEKQRAVNLLKKKDVLFVRIALNSEEHVLLPVSELAEIMVEFKEMD